MKKSTRLIVVLAVLLFHLPCQAQKPSNEILLSNLTDLDKNTVYTPTEKLRRLYGWKSKAETLGWPQDSVYAKLLHRIGVLEYQVDKNYNLAVALTLRAVEINTATSPGASLTGATTDLYNVAFYYNEMNLFKEALFYYDSAVLLAGLTNDVDNVMASSRLDEAYIYFLMGDYEKAVEVSDRGIAFSLKKRDSLNYLFFLNQRAQALFVQDRLPAALGDLRIAVPLAQSLHQSFDLASALKTRGLIFFKQREFPLAEAAFHQCIAERFKSRDLGQVSGDFNDLGAFYSDSLRSFDRAAACYSTAIQYARRIGDSTKMARASLNLGRTYFYEAKFDSAIFFYLRAMCYLKINRGSGFFANPAVEELSPIGNKELLQTLFNSKTELLLALYKQRHDPGTLAACLKTALVNDSLINAIRHEQLGEQSKLYWRNRCRGFYFNALQACYFANDHQLAFYFMEKSRSVLLQDKLAELGAAGFLPKEEASRREKLQIGIVELQQRLSLLPDSSAESKTLQLRLVEAKADLEQYIKSLERTYPNYYQYKFADEVRSLASVQDFLAKNRQDFIDYFIGDTLSFALCITRDNSKFIAIHEDMGGLLSRFAQFCSDENAQSNRFSAFLIDANRLYGILIKPFDLPGGRVIICQDNYLIPFEALSRDAVRPDFLVNYYAFSYVYSARYLLNQYEAVTGKGDFLGIAPVNFSAYAGLPNLKQSELALRNCSEYYHHSKLLVQTDASRQNFMAQVAYYNTTTILTHAKADSADEEPALYMNDSVIHLSELQMLKKPAAKLIVLSACQTNVGKSRNGEGIFSLARGFSAAGIPAVAATQWVADEQATYNISAKFNEFISAGMSKDDALQKAKLFYILQDKRGNILPYYWADMVLIGNTDPVKFMPGFKFGWLIPAMVLALILILYLFYRFGPLRVKKS